MYKKTSEYKNFIKKYFPYSGVINNPNAELLYFRICENNIITEIYEKYITSENQEQNIACHLEFLQRYRIQFNNLLLYIPISEPNGINFCMRATIENLLKFLYSIYTDDDLKSITVCKFRDIKERLNKLETELFINKDKINNLVSYYGKFSNSIHDKNCNNKTQLEYMESIIQSNQLDLLGLNNNLLNILNVYETLISNIFRISEKTLSVSDMIRLRNTLTTKRFEKVKKHLYQEK
ncbi:hypothetical protein [Clostridium lundense]|uniref:hypothetical protein n=1 Tax=Clostridium lundense TaxID=319475 RepID=UPI0004871BEB|nr:hypothetical protein [Clostridium lundense]